MLDFMQLKVFSIRTINKSQLLFLHVFSYLVPNFRVSHGFVYSLRKKYISEFHNKG